MRSWRIHKFAVFLAAALAAAGLSACSSGSSTNSSTSLTSDSKPELSTVTLDARLIPDTAPLWVAVEDGFFKQEGLTVKIRYPTGTAASFAGLADHSVNFAQQAYVTMFSQEQKNPSLAMRIIAEDTQSAPNTNVIMVSGESKVTSVADLAGKSVAFPSPGLGLGELALDEQLKGYGLGPTSYTTNVLSYSSMAQPLSKNQIAGAFSVQPYITLLQSQSGAHQLIDLMTGPMANFPQLGWTTTAWFVQHYPRTVAAFQRAIVKAQQVAASDQVLVRKLISKNITSISPQIANIIPISTFNTTTSLARMQRVATVMQQFGALPKSFDVKSIVIAPSAGT